MTDQISATLCGHVLPVSLQPATETAAEHDALRLPGTTVSELRVASPALGPELPTSAVVDGIKVRFTPTATGAGPRRREYQGRQILATSSERNVEVSVAAHAVRGTVREAVKPMRTTAPIAPEPREAPVNAGVSDLAKINEPVFVRFGAVRWHTSLACTAPARREGIFTYRCSLLAAHRSRLVPCETCARPLADMAAATWGRVASGDRRRFPLRRLYRLRTLPAETKVDHPDLPTEAEARFPYGRAQGADDSRLRARNSLDWGAGNYRQDPEEFLGETVEDDHDWRALNRLTL